MTRRSKVTDAQLENLSDAVGRLVQVFSEDLQAIDAGVAELAEQVGRDIAILEARVDALFVEPEFEQQNIDDIETPELEDILEDLRRREAVASVALDGETQVVSDGALDDDTLAWEITETGAKVFSAGGRDALSTVAALLELINDNGLENASIIDIHVSFGQVDEQGLAFDGLATVGY